MINKRFFGGLILGGLFLIVVCASIASAQCCGTAAVSTFAPAYTTAYAPAPVVWQTYRPTTGWYPGALIDRWRINRWERWNSGTVVTAAYAPTYPTAYTAAYAPTFPPSYYATSFRPVTPIVQTVAFASAVSSCDPCGSSREVVMRPVCDTCSPCVSPCSGCATGCSSCAGTTFVGQAMYETSGSTGCAGCATTAPVVMPQSAYGSQGQSPTPANGHTPQPGISPHEQVPEERRRPSEESVLDQDPANGAAPKAGEAAPVEPSSTLLQPPALFDPSDRVTKNNAPNVPVWTAVYHSSSPTTRPTTSQTVASPQPVKKIAPEDRGWTSAGN